MRNIVNFPGVRVEDITFMEGKKGPYAVINAVETKTGSSYQFLAYDELSEFAKKSHIRKGDHLNVSGYMQRYTKHLKEGVTDMRTSIIIQNLYNMGDLGEKKQMANSVCFFDLEILPQADGAPYKISNGPLVISTHETSVGSQRIKLVAFDGMMKVIQDMQLRVGEHVSVKGTLQKYEMQTKDGRKTYPVTCKVSEIEKLSVQATVAEQKTEELPTMKARPSQNGIFSSTPKKSFG